MHNLPIMFSRSLFLFVEADLQECHGLPTNITPNRIHLETGKHGKRTIASE